ncbi:MAG TPA: (Fe-S)-binding protein [Clostridia bacterium]|nr:(Fe-S)-binding protein [Clostridia bacterium]
MQHESFFDSLAREALICARCGYCKVECPVYQELGWESASPRAKMVMAREIINGSISEKQVERVFQCTLCGKCREVCSTSIDTVRAWQELRQHIAGCGLAPDNMKQLTATIADHANITGDEQGNREMWLDSLDDKFKAHVGQPAEVLYFTGCSSSLYPAVYAVPQSFVQLLDLAEVSFGLLGQEEECCGFPLIGAGAFSQGKEMVQRNVRKIQKLGAKRVVTTCPSCYHTLKDTYPQVLGYELPFDVMHASQFLLELINQGKLELHEVRDTVTYHDPCDLGRNSGVYDAPRQVINSIPGIEFVEMPKNREYANCCGGGGNLQAVDGDLVERIGLRRVLEGQATGAKTLLSSCQQCKRTLQNAARKHKVRIRVQDLTELVLKSAKP